MPTELIPQSDSQGRLLSDLRQDSFADQHGAKDAFELVGIRSSLGPAQALEDFVRIGQRFYNGRIGATLLVIVQSGTDISCATSVSIQPANASRD